MNPIRGAKALRAGATNPSAKWVVLGVLVFITWVLALRVRTGVHSGGLRSIKTIAMHAPSGVCHVEEHAEYHGEILKGGRENFQSSAAECCESCRKHKGCNIWVWCGRQDGCAQDTFGHCCLKKQEPVNLVQIAGHRSPNVAWTSGGSYSEDELHAAQAAEQARVDRLVKDPSLPMVWMDVAIKGKPIGRITFVLFSKEAPMAAENFRALCTGEKGVVPEGRDGAGKPYHFKGKPFYRIIHGFIDQGGAETESVFGGQFKDDPDALKLKHDRKGLLSMANTGHDTNDSHFSIMIGPQPHLDGRHPVFGEVVAGWEVVEQVNNLSLGKKDETATAEDGAIIVNSGQIRCGQPCGAPELYKKIAEERKAEEKKQA